MRLAGSPGPHVFVASLESPALDEDDRHHLTTVLRLRPGDELTISDGAGSWRPARYGGAEAIEPAGPIVSVPEPEVPTTVACARVKGDKPELVVQKLTELGIDRIVLLTAERSVVRWDDDAVAKRMPRWLRIVREAAMQSHRVRLPVLEVGGAAVDWLSRPDVAVAHFDGRPISADVRSIAIGPEGGWSEAEREVAGSRTVSLGPTVLRTETAAIAAATLLCANSRPGIADTT